MWQTLDEAYVHAAVIVRGFHSYKTPLLNAEGLAKFEAECRRIGEACGYEYRIVAITEGEIASYQVVIFDPKQYKLKEEVITPVPGVNPWYSWMIDNHGPDNRLVMHDVLEQRCIAVSLIPAA